MELLGSVFFLLSCMVFSNKAQLYNMMDTNQTPKNVSGGTMISNETDASNMTMTNQTTPEETTDNLNPEITNPVDLAHILMDNMGEDPFKYNKSSLDPTIGTHIIAPCMFNKESFCAQNIPLGRLVANAVMLDMRDVVWDNASASITEQDFVDWEAKNAPIPNGTVVLIQTGWSRFWSNVSAYRGSDSTDSAKFVFPDIDVSAAQWLVTNRNFTGVGIDSYSLERGNATDVHSILAQRDMFVLENLDQLDYLESFGSKLFVTPLKVHGAGAVPCGVLAMVTGEPFQHPAPTLPPPTTTTTTTSTTTAPVPNANPDNNVIPDKGASTKDDPSSQKSNGDNGSSGQYQPTTALILLCCIVAVVLSIKNDYVR